MIKVTVLYNLPPGTDEAEFVQWRMTTHHTPNTTRPEVLRSDFYRTLGTARVGDLHPAGAAPWRFMTESWWQDYETFDAAWNDPSEQARLIPAVAKISDAIFLISEELQTYVKG
jgi:hypothetical protein